MADAPDPQLQVVVKVLEDPTHALQQTLTQPDNPDPALRTPRPAKEPKDGPTRNFHEKDQKNTPRPEILDSQKLPSKYPEITEKSPPPPKKKFPFWVFFGYFLGVPEFRPGGSFFGVFRGIGNENSAQSFSDRSFWKSFRVVDVRAFGSWMSAPKCLLFQEFYRPDRSFGPGYPRE